jgi:DNA-binding LacI/PurR family transcriptional regulator
MVTMVDIARMAGVSPATVSRVLTGSAMVNAETRAKVMAVIEAHDFKRNPMAQGLRSGRGTSVAMLVGDIEQSNYSALTRFTQEGLAELGLDLLLYNLGHCEKRLIQFLERAPAMRLRGIVIASPDAVRESRALKNALATLTQEGIALVAIGQQLGRLGIPSIVYDETAAVESSVAYLIAANHAPVAYLGRIEGSAPGTERFAGYSAAHRTAKLRIHKRLVWDVAYRHRAGYDAVAKALDEGLEFRAIQAGSDELALGAIAALRDRGRRTPEDVAVVGLGDIEWGQYVRPALSTLSTHPEDVALRVRELLERGAAQAPAEWTPLQRTLIKRASA